MKTLKELLREIQREVEDGYVDTPLSRVPSLLQVIKMQDEALMFYSGEAKDAEWNGPTLVAYDKFGGLAEEISGPKVAKMVRAKALKILAGD